MRRWLRRKRWSIIRRKSPNCNAHARVEVAFDHHPRLEREFSIIAATTYLWLFLEILDLVETLGAFEIGWNGCLCFKASAMVLCNDRGHGRDLPSPVPQEAFWSLLQYLCCRNSGCTRTLTRVNLPCGMYCCGQVFEGFVPSSSSFRTSTPLPLL